MWPIEKDHPVPGGLTGHPARVYGSNGLIPVEIKEITDFPVKSFFSQGI